MTFLSVNNVEAGGAEVWLAQFDPALTVRAVQPALRNDYILAATDPLLRRQRYAVWRLLDVALAAKSGKGADERQFRRLPSGKWVCDPSEWYFSLSHSGNVVAVALCDVPVGVDVQRLEDFVGRDELARRILDSDERARFDTLAGDSRVRYLAEMWAAKESLFKQSGGEVFVPSDWQGSSALTLSAPNGYVAAVAAK